MESMKNMKKGNTTQERWRLVPTVCREQVRLRRGASAPGTHAGRPVSPVGATAVHWFIHRCRRWSQIWRLRLILAVLRNRFFMLFIPFMVKKPLLAVRSLTS